MGHSFRAFPVLVVLMLLAGTLFGTIGCTDEITNPLMAETDTVTIIKDLYWSSERTGLATVSVKDTLVKSDATFKQTSTFYNEKEQLTMKFYPTAYLNVRLAKQRIDVLKKRRPAGGA